MPRLSPLPHHCNGPILGSFAAITVRIYQARKLSWNSANTKVVELTVLLQLVKLESSHGKNNDRVSYGVAEILDTILNSLPPLANNNQSCVAIIEQAIG